MTTEWEKYKDSAEQLVAAYRFAEAENFWMLAVREADNFAENDPRTAYTLDRLADCFFKQSRYPEAEQVFRLALELRKKYLGATHLDVAKSLSNLADLYVTQRRDNEAEPITLEILAIYEHNFGPDHPGVATIVTNLALFYHALKRFSDAEFFYKRAMNIKQKLYGYKSPEVKGLTEKYAEMLQECERVDEAEQLIDEAAGTASGVWRAVTSKREEDMTGKAKKSGFFDRIKKKNS